MSPAHFLKHLYYNQPYYGDLSIDDNFKNFIQTAIDLCTIHFSPWNMDLNADEILTHYGSQQRNAIMLSDFMMQNYAQKEGYKSYFCKDNGIYEFALDIADKLPESKFIYLYRDPRDFVLSQLKRPASHYSVLKYAQLWVYEQTKSIRVAEELKLNDRCYWLSYEELIENTAMHIQNICNFIGADYTPNDEAASKDKIVDSVHEWKNLDKGVISDNKEKYKKELSAYTIKMIESKTHNKMSFLGYRAQSNKAPVITKIGKIYDMFYSLYKRTVTRLRKEKTPKMVIQRTALLKKLAINYTNRG